MTGTMFSRRKRKQPAPGELATVNAKMAAAHARVAAIEGRIVRLRSAIEAEGPAHEEAQRAIAADDAADLCRASAGDAASHTATLIAAAENATRVASAARTAFARAEAELAEAREEVMQIGRQRMAAIGEALLRRADTVAVEYAEAFRKLCKLHDRVHGICNALSAVVPRELIITDEDLFAPRFELPSLAITGGEWSPNLRYVMRPGALTVTETRDLWASVIGRLIGDDSADIPVGATIHDL